MAIGPMSPRQIMRQDMRRMRAMNLSMEVIRIVRDCIPDCEEVYESDCLRTITRRLNDLFHQEGVEVLTDSMRQEMGLPARGPDGWTVEEILLMEQRRLDAMRAPLPVLIVERKP